MSGDHMYCVGGHTDMLERDRDRVRGHTNMLRCHVEWGWMPYQHVAIP